MSSQPEIDMRPGGEVASNFHPHPQTDSSAGEVSLYQNPLDQEFTRREVLTGVAKRGVELAAVSLFGGLGLKPPRAAAASAEPDTTRNFQAPAANAELNLVGEPNFGLPVPMEERDVRIKNIDLPKITVDPKLITNPLGRPIEDVRLNPKFKTEERRNRIGVAIGNALGRAYTLSEAYGRDPSSLIGLYARKGDFPTPDWAEFELKLAESKGKGGLMLPLWALPEDAPSTKDNVQPLEADITKGMDIRFVAEQGVIPTQVDNDGNFINSFSFRVDADGQLSVEIFQDNSEMSLDGFASPQELYNFNSSLALGKALTLLGTTLGGFDQENSPLFSYIVGNYGNKFVNGEFFPEQTQMLVGTYDPDFRGFPDSIFHVEFAGK